MYGNHMKVLVLWTKPSGYFFSQLSALKSLGHEVHLIMEDISPDAPFERDKMTLGIKTIQRSDNLSNSAISQFIDELEPAMILICSWHIRHYMRAIKKKNCTRILCMDNQWRRSPKQVVGVILRNFLIKPYFDGVILPGERQEKFAKLLGFNDLQIVRGGYSCDITKFEVIRPSLSNRTFLYVGRLSKEKDLITLISAYSLYRDLVNEPWSLKIVGAGPERIFLEGLACAGIEFEDFVQPPELPNIYGSASCFVLPSNFEPWGVVIHEAVASGLPVICTDICGASDEFVEDGKNGYLYKHRDIGSLVKHMLTLHNISISEWQSMSALSRTLSRKITPDSWARNLLDVKASGENYRSRKLKLETDRTVL